VPQRFDIAFFCVFCGVNIGEVFQDRREEAEAALQTMCTGV
jgi:hypothetical protein